MKVKELSVSFSRKVSKDYQSWDFSAGETIIIEDGDDIEKIHHERFENCKKIVIDQIKKSFQPPKDQQ